MTIYVVECITDTPVQLGWSTSRGVAEHWAQKYNKQGMSCFVTEYTLDKKCFCEFN